MNFILKSMLKKQMAGIPPEQQEKILSAFEKDPDFFKKIGEEIKQKMKEGKDQQTAAMEVMMANQAKLSELMQ